MYQLSILTLVYAIASILIIFCLFFILQQQTKPCSRALTPVLFSVLIWCLAAIFEAGAMDVAFKLFWSQVMFFGVVTLPPFWLLFTVEFQGHGSKITKTHRILLLIMPFITQTLVLTNSYHRLIWKDISIHIFQGINYAIYSHGTWFHIHTAYSYLLILIGLIILIKPSRQTKEIVNKKPQTIWLILLLLAIWPINILHIFGLSLVYGLDFTTITFAFSACALTWMIYSGKLFKLIPITRSIMIDAITEGLIVVDTGGIVMDINAAALEMIGHKGKSPLGKETEKLFENISPLKMMLQSRKNLTKEITLSRNPTMYWKVHTENIADKKGQPLGKMILLQNITNLKRQSVFQEIIQKISQSFIHVGLDSISLEIRKALGKLCRAVSADRAYIFDYDFNRQVATATHEWCSKGIEPQIRKLQGLPFSMMEDWIISHSKGSEIHIPDVKKMPHSFSREILEARGIKSLMAVPMMKGKDCKGVVVFDSVRILHTYSELEQRLLQDFGNLLLLTFERLKTEEKLTNQSQKLSGLYDLVLISGSMLKKDELLKESLKQIRAILGCEVVGFYKKQGVQMRLVSQDGLCEEEKSRLKYLEWSEEFGIHNLILMDGKGKEIGFHDEIEKAGYRACALKMIEIHVHDLGLLAYLWKNTHEFKVDEIALISTMADILGVIMENERLRQLLQETATTQERRRLARDLHDSVTQSLNSLVYSAETASKVMENNPEKLARVLKHLTASAMQALKDLRLLLYELRLVPSEEINLVEVLKMRLDAVEARANIKATLFIEERMKWPKTWERELYPIAIESLNNALRHGCGNEVEVRIEKKGGRFCMSIKDNGQGFKMGKEKAGGMGLRNMAERAERLGGRLVVISDIGKGTFIEIFI